MGRVQAGMGRPIQGMSQQADRDRINGQCTLQENMIPSVLDSLYKRIGTRHIAELPLSADKPYDARTTIHFYDRGDEEKYFIFIEPDHATPYVFRVDGLACPVSAPQSTWDYMTDSDPLKNISFSTIGDYTFLANGSVTVRARTDVLPPNPTNKAIVYCQFATYRRTYTVVINGNTDGTGGLRYSLTMPGSTYSGNEAAANAAAQRISTDDVCQRLAYMMREGIATGDWGTTPQNAAPTYGGVVYTEKMNVEVYSNCLFVTHPSAAINTITTIDGANGGDLIAVQGRVKSPAYLPPYAPVGWTILIQNTEGVKKNNYWLRATGTDGSKVKWEESLEGGARLGFDARTMPHQLYRDQIVGGVPQFVLQAGPWDDRAVGNDTTVPFPSFLDATVESVGTFQNRLFFTSGESAIFTRSNDFYNFFKESSQTETDADPIDAFSDSEKVNLIKNSVTVDGDAIFFASNGQFMVDGSKPVTHANVVFKQVTSFPMNIFAKPAITGESIMFAYDAGNWSGIREMFTDSDKDTKSARPITEHVEKLIKGQVRQLSSNPNTNTLIVRTDTDAHIAYVYDWLWQGADKVQAAWHKWTFDTGSKLLHVQFVDDDVYFIFLHADGKVYLEHMPLTNDDNDEGMTFPCRLDRKITISATYNSTTQKWGFTVPFVIRDADLSNWLAIMGTGCYNDDIGTEFEFDRSLGQTTFVTDISLQDPTVATEVKIVMGRKFVSRYIPTQPFLRDQQGLVMSIDRMTMGRMTVNYDRTGAFKVLVSDPMGRQWQYPFYGRYMGSFNNKIGFAPLISGTFPFPVRLFTHDATIEIQSDSHLPLQIRGLEWEGSYQQTGRRL
ncbi:tail tubular protein B [Pseudomonas phage Nerthus]|uniref:Tail tubular protein B n=1 Tax=Pseudomonas phage Nerthus TaxID=2163984 RepID=A0A2S1GMR2_9CAUD|nr:tail tubular protein B [Pseudomonas phage Nerthus]AWD90664.1 tail tubular protein B [Pseudomonas phage Nerthus]